MKNLFIILVSTFLSHLALASSQSCISTASDIIEKLRCLPQVQVQSSSNILGGLKVEMTFEQKADHNNPDSETFLQKLVLLHRSESEPMLLQTSGYHIYSVRFAHIANVYQTNQLQVEHRYFQASIPETPDYSLLNIEQSAKDFHEITMAFQQIYTKPWVNTGASKGGMTSLYHRYFFPNDVAGTVADVAPLSFSRDDQRYIHFLQNVGGEEFHACRKAFSDMQVLLLKNRDQFVPGIQGDFKLLGGADVAFEHSTIEVPFYFWQYGNPDLCNSLPDQNNLQAIYQFFQILGGMDGYTDSSISTFMPYYYQAATQLGSPASDTSHLETMRKYDFSINQYISPEIPLSYNNQEMRKVQKWAEEEANEILYVYGEFDPWTAGEFPESQSGKNTLKLIVPRGNHGANFTKLPPKKKEQAMAMISRWLQKEPVSQNLLWDFLPQKSLEDIEFKMRRSQKQ